MFLYGMKSPATKEKYIGRLARFFDFLGLQGSMEEKSNAFAEKGKNAVWAFTSILRFVQKEKERVDRKEISPATLRNYVKAIKLFCEMNDIAITWKKITRGLPKCRRFADDRAPTIEEIRKITEYPDRRIRALIYTMSSSGMRLEAWEYLRWKHIQPIEHNGNILAAKIVIYPGDPEEYFSFITREAYDALKNWMQYREQAGERISGESWVMRDLWSTKKGCIQGFIAAPKQLKSTGVKRLVEDALWTQGVRDKLPEGKKRHEFQANHGFRKWFKTRCELAGVKPINIETLMGHSTGISDSYYRPNEHELLQDYLKAEETLTISKEHSLRKEIQGLQNKLQDEGAIKAEIAEIKDVLQKFRLLT